MSDQTETNEAKTTISLADQIAKHPTDSKDGFETQLRANLKSYTDLVKRYENDEQVAKRNREAYERYVNTTSEQLLTLLNKKQGVKERRAAAKERRKERDRVSILQTIQNLSPEALADALIKQGVSKIGKAELSPRGILSEALDHIEATFWVKNAEVNSNGIYADESQIPAELKKYLTVNVKEGIQVVTGMCSIGALAIARVALAEEDEEQYEGVPPYENLIQRDVATRIAGDALARAIYENSDQYPLSGWANDRSGSLIAKWNDNEQRTREEIVEIWEYALVSPLLDQDEIWTISLGAENYSWKPKGVNLTHEEAVAIEEGWNAGQDHPLIKGLMDYTGYSRETIAGRGGVKAMLSYPEPQPEAPAEGTVSAF